MMSLKSTREFLEVVQPRYLKANKAEKQKILDEFTSATGYHRKHAIRILKNQVQVQNHLERKTKTYKTIYRGEVVQPLNRFGRSMDAFAPNGYNHFYLKRLKCWSDAKKSSFPKTPKTCS